MYHNHVFDDVNTALPALLMELENADEVGSRAGRVREMMHVGITLEKPWRREVLVEHRKPSIAAQIAETMWVLAGRSDIGWLSHYLPRAADFSDDGVTWRAGYGGRIRAWDGDAIDQLETVVDRLRANPLDRRAVIGIWDPTVDNRDGKDIACNNWLSFSSRLGKLDLHVAIRSNDVIWGWSGINAFEWSALQEIVAGLLGLQQGALHFSTTSFHLYQQHWAKANKIVEHAASTYPAQRPADSPRFDGSVVDRDLGKLDDTVRAWFILEEMIRNGYCPDDAVDAFTEPMLRSWLRVLQWWWTGDRDYLAPLKGTALEAATFQSVQPPERSATVVGHDQSHPFEDDGKGHCGVTVMSPSGNGGFICSYSAGHRVHLLPESTPPKPEPSAFIRFAVATHIEKHAAYGDSWKKRGEMLGIMANIARKVDRLGKGETSDETSADTAMDLMVYLAKYRTWLMDQRVFQRQAAPVPGTSSDTPDAANELLLHQDRTQGSGYPWDDDSDLENVLTRNFTALERAVTERPEGRVSIVSLMLGQAYRLARTLWENEQDEYKGADVD